MNNKAKKIYMIGVKGVGMTMLAQFLSAKGNEVIGSDVEETFMTDQVLQKAGVKVLKGFNENNIPNDADIIIYSTAYNKNTNVEVAKVLNSEKKVKKYAEALGELFNTYYGIAVAGSHGKTTTSAWLGFVLMKSSYEPNVSVGARVPQFDGSSIIGKSNYFVCEVDEYQNKLQYFNPKVVLLNNIEYDHPDVFPTVDDYNNVFIEFVKKISKKGFLVINNDDEVIRKKISVNTRAKIISYAIKESADYVAYDIKEEAGKQYFKVKIGVDSINENDIEGDFSRGDDLGDFVIQLAGIHNVYNALAVIATCIELDIDLSKIREYLEDFKGTARRMEVLGHYKGALIIDDYAHHPTEIKTTIKGIKSRYSNKRIITVFHPHTFTRTKALIEDFAKCFNDSDEVIVLDIYGSARENQGGVHSKDLVEKIKKNNPNVRYIPNFIDTEDYLRSNLGSNDLLLLMGAGDVFRIGENLVN